MKNIVIIPARGGSKGVPYKNIKMLCGKPLIAYTIDAAKKVFNLDEIVVSTDDENIIKCLSNINYKVPFKRPLECASDLSPMVDVIHHALNFYKDKGKTPETIILLQPTSPFRTSKHITEALDLFNKNNAEMVTSVFETSSNPYYVLFEKDKNGYLKKSKNSNFKRRQDCPEVLELNGAIYIIKVTTFLDKGFNVDTILGYEMNKIDSIDIDDQFDWDLAQLLLSKK